MEMKNLMNWIPVSTLTLLCGLFCASCASNDFKRFYTDFTKTASPDVIAKLFEPYSGSSTVYSTNNPEADAYSLASKGFQLLGSSGFESAGVVTNDMLLSQAKSVGADIVLCQSAYVRSEQGVRAVPIYNPGQTTTTNANGVVTADAYGTGGSGHATANFYGAATTTTSGTFSTQFVPQTYHRYSHNAWYWRKAKPRMFGADIDDLPEAERRRLGRNTGVFIKLVVIDSPAFRANLFSGDIIIKIGTDEIYSGQDFSSKIERYEGTKVPFTIIRDSVEKVLDVQLGLKPKDK